MNVRHVDGVRPHCLQHGDRRHVDGRHVAKIEHVQFWRHVESDRFLSPKTGRHVESDSRHVERQQSTCRRRQATCRILHIDGRHVDSVDAV
jgi:hypothetical protein